jgi:hypothetical protein
VVKRAEQEGHDGVEKACASERECLHASHGPTGNAASLVFPLDVGYPSQDVVRGQDPWIDRIGVIPSGPDSFCINGDNAVDDFSLTSWLDKNDYISWPDWPVVVGNDAEAIPIHEERVHAGADIIDKSLFHGFYLLHWLCHRFSLADQPMQEKQVMASLPEGHPRTRERGALHHCKKIVGNRLRYLKFTSSREEMTYSFPRAAIIAGWKRASVIR